VRYRACDTSPKTAWAGPPHLHEVEFCQLYAKISRGQDDVVTPPETLVNTLLNESLAIGKSEDRFGNRIAYFPPRMSSAAHLREVFLSYHSCSTASLSCQTSPRADNEDSPTTRSVSNQTQPRERERLSIISRGSARWHWTDPSGEPCVPSRQRATQRTFGWRQTQHGCAWDVSCYAPRWTLCGQSGTVN